MYSVNGVSIDQYKSTDGGLCSFMCGASNYPHC